MNTPNTCLLVEDNPVDRAILTAMLMKHFDVNPVSTLQECLAVMQMREPDVVLLDLGLPDSESAEQTLRDVKMLRRNAAIVVVSGNSDPEFIKKCILATASGYVVKHSKLGRQGGDVHLVDELQKAIRSQQLISQVNRAIDTVDANTEFIRRGRVDATTTFEEGSK